MRYALLLRGINVGGNNKVSMADLKHAFTESGCTNVKTYINSGNIIFETNVERESVELLVTAILGRYPFNILYALLNKDEYKEEVASLPPWWTDELARKDVLFCTSAVDFEYVKERILAMSLGDERVSFGRKAVFWGKNTEKEYLRTAYHKLLLKESFYKQMTIRNGRTFEKIRDMLEEN